MVCEEKRVGFHHSSARNRPHSHTCMHTHMHSVSYAIAENTRSTLKGIHRISPSLSPCLGGLSLSFLDHQRQQSHETLGLVAGPQQVWTWPQRQRRGGWLQHGACNTWRGENFQTWTPAKRPGPSGVWEVPLSLHWGWHRWERLLTYTDNHIYRKQ